MNITHSIQDPIFQTNFKMKKQNSRKKSDFFVGFPKLESESNWRQIWAILPLPHHIQYSRSENKKKNTKKIHTNAFLNGGLCSLFIYCKQRLFCFQVSFCPVTKSNRVLSEWVRLLSDKYPGQFSAPRQSQLRGFRTRSIFNVAECS